MRDKEKARKARKKYYLANRDKIFERRKIQRKTIDPVLAGYSAKKRYCERNGIRFELTIEEFQALKAIPQCQACKRAIRVGASRGNADGSSIDQINPGQGYWMGNVGVLCRRCNAIKSDATPAEIAAVAAYAGERG